MMMRSGYEQRTGAKFPFIKAAHYGRWTNSATALVVVTTSAGHDPFFKRLVGLSTHAEWQINYLPPSQAKRPTQS